MSLQKQAIKYIKKNSSLQHKTISIQLATPRTLATFYLGYLLYTRYIDHQIRKQFTFQSKSLKPYIELYFHKQRHSFGLQNYIPIFGILSSVYAYTQSKNIYWIIGGTACLGIIGVQHILISPLRERLFQQYIDNSIVSEKKQMQRTQSKFQIIRKLTNHLTKKIVISAIAVTAFYLAELKHSDQIDLKVNLNK